MFAGHVPNVRLILLFNLCSFHLMNVCNLLNQKYNIIVTITNENHVYYECVLVWFWMSITFCFHFSLQIISIWIEKYKIDVINSTTFYEHQTRLSSYHGKFFIENSIILEKLFEMNSHSIWAADFHKLNKLWYN